MTSPPTRAGIQGEITKVTRTYYKVSDTNNWLYKVKKDQVKEDDQSTINSTNNTNRQLTERHRNILKQYGIKLPPDNEYTRYPKETDKYNDVLGSTKVHHRTNKRPIPITATEYYENNHTNEASKGHK